MIFIVRTDKAKCLSELRAVRIEIPNRGWLAGSSVQIVDNQSYSKTLQTLSRVLFIAISRATAKEGTTFFLMNLTLLICRNQVTVLRQLTSLVGITFPRVVEQGIIR